MPSACRPWSPSSSCRSSSRRSSEVTMRLSVYQDDRGYRAFKALPKGVTPAVTVDGATVPMVVTADDRLGYVLAIDVDSNGRAQLNSRRNGVKHKQMRGRVVIELQKASV